MDVVGRVRASASRHDLWTPDTPVIVAVSGGADSVALTLILHELAADGLVRLAGLVHLHHHIRGRAADDDADFVASLAERLSLSLELAHADVPAAARAAGESLEVAARRARLALFERLVGGAASPRIALAHTRTDQAETVLLRLSRGAGSRGLAAMAPRTGHRIRPLLDVGRAELRAWLRDRGEAWREDETNADRSVARNLVRLDVLPLLERLNPMVETAVARASSIQRADADLLDHLAAVEARRLIRKEEGSIHLDLEAVRQLPEALARRVLRQALLLVAPGRTPGWDDTEALLRLTSRRWENRVVRLELFGSLAVLSRKGLPTPARLADPSRVSLDLSVPGSVRHPAGWWSIDATGPSSPGDTSIHDADSSSPPETRVVLDAGALGRHLTIRSWRPGDRVQPLGLGGRKKLQDVFVDRKVPRDQRPYVPVVTVADGRIAWVAGHVVGESFRVTPRSEAVVVLTLRP